MDSGVPEVHAQPAARVAGEVRLVDSDFFKTNAATQAQFSSLGSNLTKTIDFGIGDSVAKLAQQFATQQASWLKTLGPTLVSLLYG